MPSLDGKAIRPRYIEACQQCPGSIQVAPQTLPVAGDFLDYHDVMAKFDTTMEWLARTYVHAMNCIHYMHDKYFYERLEMALFALPRTALRWAYRLNAACSLLDSQGFQCLVRSTALCPKDHLILRAWLAVPRQ